MNFGFVGMKRPEDLPQTFNIYRGETETSARGRERQQEPVLIAEGKRFILSRMKPEERLTFHQMEVTVTHTIFWPEAQIAKENDVFKVVHKGKETRSFRVKAVRPHGEQGIFVTYYCEERSDTDGIRDQSPGDS